MKKIISYFLMFLGVIVLAGCELFNSEATQEKQALKQYFKNQDVLSVEKLDEDVRQLMESSDIELFNDLQVENTKITLTQSEKTVDAYLWQKQQKIYLGTEVEEEVSTTFIDLSELSAAQEQLYDTYKPSEILDMMLEEMLGDMLSVEDIIEVLKFKAEDFDYVEKGKFELKQQVFLEKILYLSKDAFDNLNDLKEAVEDEGIVAHLYLYFDGTSVTGWELNVDNSLATDAQATSLNFKITFVENVLSSLKISFVVDEMYFSIISHYDVSGLITQLYYEVDDDYYQVWIYVQENNFRLTVNHNSVDLVTASLSTEVKGDKLQLNGSFIYDGTVYADGNYIELKIVSNENVIIPDVLEAAEKTAVNLMQ